MRAGLAFWKVVVMVTVDTVFRTPDMFFQWEVPAIGLGYSGIHGDADILLLFLHYRSRVMSTPLIYHSSSWTQKARHQHSYSTSSGRKNKNGSGGLLFPANKYIYWIKTAFTHRELLILFNILIVFSLTQTCLLLQFHQRNLFSLYPNI